MFEKETQAHIDRVGYYIDEIIIGLIRAKNNHDVTKLLDPEREIFERVTPKLKTLTYGSEEYDQQLKDMQVALDHHYKFNPHHPEHYERGISGMDLVDLIEMICDWKAASERHDDGDIYKSIELNKKRFAMSDQLVSILTNTVDRYFAK